MRYALRQLAANPGFTVIALLTLALGIGVNTTAFTVLNRLMLESLPFHEPAKLMQVSVKSGQAWNNRVTPADFFDIREQNSVFTAVAAYQPGNQTSFAEIGKPPVQVGALYMTANFFTILGIQPEMGRLPSDDESKKMAFVTLISDSFWRKQYNSDPNILGRTIRLNSRDSIIIGVMPPSMDDPALFNNHPAIFYLDPVTHSRDVRTVGWDMTVARLKPGIAIQTAQADLDVLAKRLAHDYPETNKDRTFSVTTYPTNQLGQQGSQLTWMTIALSALVLLIACINLANLQLVRTTRRSNEFAIRLSLGCPRRRLVGMLLLESVILSVAGGALGIGLALWSNAFVAQYLNIDMPLNLRVFAFIFLVALGTGALFGAGPAWVASRSNIGSALKAGSRGSTSGRSRHWVRQSLVVIELAMALTLLAGAGFFIGGIYRLTHRALGWDATHEVLGYIPLDQDHFAGPKNLAHLLTTGDQTLEALRAMPGVEAAAISSDSPSWGTSMEYLRIEGRPIPEKGKEPLAGYLSASPGWFQVFGMHLLEGREFTDADRADSAQVAIVNQSMAHKYWPGESALGKRIAIYDPGAPKDVLVWAQVVGVMADFKGGGEFYNTDMNSDKFLRPWTQDRESWRGLVTSLRTVGPPGAQKEPLRKVMGVILPDLAMSWLVTIDEDTASTYSYFTFLRRILVLIAGLGLLLSGIGIYGVVANLASERTKEIGIRMALGAQPGGIVWLFVRNGLFLASIGAAIGLGAAYFLVTTLGRIIPNLPGKDPWFVASSAAVLVGVALVACWLPARRTARINPTIALRAD